MKTALKITLVLVFVFIVCYQIKSYALKQSLVYDQCLTYVHKNQELIDNRQIEILEVEAEVSRDPQAVGFNSADSKLASIYASRINDLSSTRNEKLKSKQSLAELYLKTAQPDRAYNLASEALADQPYLATSSALLVLITQDKVNAYLKERKFDEAINEYNNLLKLPLQEGYQAAVESQIASIYRKKGDPEAAIEAYRKVILNHPYITNYQALAALRISEIYLKNKDYPKAKEELSNLIKLYPNTPWAKKARLTLAEIKQ